MFKATNYMHNLESNFDKIFNITKEVFIFDVDEWDNFHAYPRKPKCSDLFIISLSISAEAIGIDSENYLYGKIKTDYPSLFRKLPHRCNYNRRKRKLREYIDSMAARLAQKTSEDSAACLIDSMPLPVCRIARSSSIKILKEDSEMIPKTGYSAIDKNYYHGYKLHCLSKENGPIVNFSITQANVHDVKMLKEMTEGFISHCTLIGDKGYISRTAQLDLFEKESITVITPNRGNQEPSKEWKWMHRKKRKRIETTFSQFCDQFLIKRNYAKKFIGYFTRITLKICAFTTLQYLNFLNKRPLNKIKYALAF